MPRRVFFGLVRGVLARYLAEAIEVRIEPADRRRPVDALVFASGTY